MVSIFLYIKILTEFWEKRRHLKIRIEHWNQHLLFFYLDETVPLSTFFRQYITDRQQHQYSSYSESDDSSGTDEAVDSTSESEDEPDGVFRWRSSEQQGFGNTEFCSTRPLSSVVQSSISLFRQYFTHEFLSEICEQSNLYAHQVNPESNFHLSVDDLEIFLGVCLYMGLFRLPNTALFWKSGTRVDQVADHMSRNRFHDIKRYLHFVDNCSKPNNPPKDFKFKPLIEQFNSVAASIEADECLAVDEQILPYKGKKNVLRQYNPRKPKKWGFKFFVLCGKSGLIHRIELYQGKSSSNPEHPTIGKSGLVVLRLLQSIPKHKNYKIFFDNWFTSPSLLHALVLDGFRAVGTLRLCRAPGLFLVTDKELMKKGRGSHDTKSATKDNVTLKAVKWFDNKSVLLISSYVGVEPQSSISRYSSKEHKTVNVPCPAIVKEYNRAMGFVDEANKHVALSRTTIHCNTRSYLRFFFHILDMAVLNSWLLYRRQMRDCGEGGSLSLYQFKSSLAEVLVKGNKKRVGHPSMSLFSSPHRRPGPQAKSVSMDVRIDNIAHWPTIMKQAKCRNLNCQSRPVTGCEKCEVNLCIKSKNCFKEFHGC